MRYNSSKNIKRNKALCRARKSWINNSYFKICLLLVDQKAPEMRHNSKHNFCMFNHSKNTHLQKKSKRHGGGPLK